MELLNQRVRITLDSLQLGAKLLSKRTVKTEKTAGPVNATNLESVRPGFEYQHLRVH